jgi:hypothetical protein
MSQTTKEPMFVLIDDPNPRANLRWFRFTIDRHYTQIHGFDSNNERLGEFNLRIPTDQIGVFIAALRKFHAGVSFARREDELLEENAKQAAGEAT